ncbi:MAG: FKBP-type peptidyl-prolyl cis-trans isomerase [Planctomycetes bacterium]|nr:FKBP-type peptidyl-prolyl cis-trans isomerase [Planctomycetota bacterium]
MKSFIVALFATFAFSGVILAGDEKAETPKEEPVKVIEEAAKDEAPSDKDTAYAFAFRMGNYMKKDGLVFDVEAFAQGLKDAFAEKEPAMGMEKLQQTLAAFDKDLQMKRMEMQKKMMDDLKKQGVENKAKGDKFLADNKNAEGVKATASGLQYQVVKEGDGAIPEPGDQVKVNYKGTLLDGQVFDASESHGGATMLPVGGGMIKGWTEGLQLMKVGSKYKFWMPADLAYGENGAGGLIGPNETIIFEVELLDIPGKKTE